MSPETFEDWPAKEWYALTMAMAWFYRRGWGAPRPFTDAYSYPEWVRFKRAVQRRRAIRRALSDAQKRADRKMYKREYMRRYMRERRAKENGTNGDRQCDKSQHVSARAERN